MADPQIPRFHGVSIVPAGSPAEAGRVLRSCSPPAGSGAPTRRIPATFASIGLQRPFERPLRPSRRFRSAAGPASICWHPRHGLCRLAGCRGESGIGLNVHDRHSGRPEGMKRVWGLPRIRPAEPLEENSHSYIGALSVGSRPARDATRSRQRAAVGWRQPGGSTRVSPRRFRHAPAACCARPRGARRP